MQYNPKELEGNVNISHVSPIREFFLLLGGLLGIAILIYLLLGFAINKVVDWMPPAAETGLGELFAEKFTDGNRSHKEDRLQDLLDKLRRHSSLPGNNYTVHLFDSPEINAVALPGRNIILFKGLLDAVDSENELAFVLAHELGHFANRDHLRGLGRGLVMVAISVAILGENNSASGFIMNSIVNTEMTFSREQELAADRYAMELLNRRYGHVGGAVDFFGKIREKNRMGRLQHYFASHPHPDSRIEALENLIPEKGLSTEGKKGLDNILKGKEQ